MLNNKKEKKVKLIDFGLARIIPPGDVVKAIIGTPEFVGNYIQLAWVKFAVEFMTEFY